MAERNSQPEDRVFTDLCLKLSRALPANKLKELRFLLQDVVGSDVLREKTFLEIIRELESRNVLRRSCLRQDGLLLCDLLDAMSLNELADTVRKDLAIETAADVDYNSPITSFRKLLVTLSEDLSRPQYLQGMASFLEQAGYNMLSNNHHDDPLEIFQAIVQAGLISSDDLSFLKKMLSSMLRQDLVNFVEEYDKRKTVAKDPYGLRNLPAGMIQRKPELDAVVKLLNSGKVKVGVVGVRNRDVIGIRGMGGIGKTVLAQSVAWTMCSSRHVIWLDVGQTPDCLALVNTLVQALGGTRSFSDIPAAQSWIRENTENKECLVVLDDVWNVDDAYVFDVLSGKCQLLITTRDADVVRGLNITAIHELGTMGENDARQLLYQSAQVRSELLTFGENMRQIVEEILKECGGLPLALALVGSSLVETRDEVDWQDVLDSLRKAELESLRSLFPKDAYPYDNLLAAIGVSFQRLEKNHQEKFLEFAIFPEDTDIPSVILEMFWSSGGFRGSPCSPRQTRSILNVLERRSLLRKSPTQEGKKSYRVHDLLLDFTRGKLRQTGCPIRDVQAAFVEIFRDQCADGKWSKFPKNSEYFFTCLPYHLSTAEEFADLLHLFFDFPWLQRKVKITSLASLISDFRFLDNASHELKLLKSSLMLSADVLDEKPDEMGAQLLGRLSFYSHEYPRIEELLKQVRKNCSNKRLLVPLHACLTEPDGPLIKIFTRRNDRVMALGAAYRGNGTIVISATTDCLITVYELETGKELSVLKGHKMAVYCLALSHDGTILASGSFDTTARIWNLDSYKEVLVLEGRGGYVNALDFSTDDQRLFTGSNDGSLKVWHVPTGHLLNSISAHDGHIRGLCTTFDGLFVVTSSLDHTIKVWCTESLTLTATLLGHTDTVYAVTSTRDSKVLVSASGDQTLKVWNLETFQELRSLCGHQEQIYSVGVTPDGRRVISGGRDMVVRLWCLATGALLFCFTGHSEAIRFVMATPDGSKVLSGSWDKSFRVWNLDTNAFKQSELPGHSRDVMDIAVNDTGSICASSSMDGTVKIWRCGSAEEKYTLTGHTKRAVSVAMSRDGSHVASLDEDSLIKVWDVELGEMLAMVELQNVPRLVQFDQTGELVLVGCENNQVSIWAWRKKGIPPKTIVLPAFTTMEIAADEATLYTCSRNDEICDIDPIHDNVSIVCQGPKTTYTTMIILPDGEAILSDVMTESSFIYWELSSCREIFYNADHPRDALVTAIDITSDGKQALTGSSLGTISLVDLESSKVVQRYGNNRKGKRVSFVAVLKNDCQFVFVDETNAIELRSLDDTESKVLGTSGNEVTSICAYGLQSVLVGCKNGELVFLGTTGERGKHQTQSGAVTRLASREIMYFASHELMYFASGSENGSVKLWSLTNTSPPGWIKVWSHNAVHQYPVTALAFIPGSEDIVSGSYGNDVKRTNAQGTVRTYSFRNYGIGALRVVGDSLIGACVRRYSYVKWSLDDGQVIKVDPHLKTVHGAGREQVARIHVPTRRVVCKGSHHSLVCWNLDTGIVSQRLPGHTHDIRALAFVPGGSFLLSGSRDKVLKLWNLETGELVDDFHFERYVLAIACASNGLVCVGLQGGQVCFFRVNSLTNSLEFTQRF